MIDSNTLVIALLTQEKLFEKTLSNIKEVKAIGASGPGGMNPSPTSLEIGHSSRFNDVLSMIAPLTSDSVLE